MAESMSEQIFSIACALSKADESEKSMLRMICTAQEESLVRALKEGVAKEDCESAFICAASWLAAAALESARAGGEEFSSLRAGDLTVTKRSSDEGSKRLSLLREQAWALMRLLPRGGDVKRALSEAFARYGMSVSVLHGGETAETKAFLQLVKRENGEEPFSVTALGAVDEQCWRYLGPEDVKIAMGDFVQCGERRYVVRAAGPFYVGEEIAYYWAMLYPKEEEA